MQQKKGDIFKNKKGQGLSTSAIVLIILGVVVLVILVLGFTLGWGKISPFIGGNNVEQIKTTCSAACSTGSVYDYCTQQRTMKADNLPGNVKEVKNTCSFFASSADYADFGIEVCSSIECPTETPENP